MPGGQPGIRHGGEGAIARVRGRSFQPPKTNGDLGAKTPAAEARSLGTKPSEARRSVGGAPSARRFLQFFNKNNAFLGIF